jgi:hypothetical protein
MFPREPVIAISAHPSEQHVICHSLDNPADSEVIRSQLMLLQSATTIKCCSNTGDSRSGKSTHLNYLLAVLAGCDDSQIPKTFLTSSQPDTCTIGIQFVVIGTMGGEVVVIIDSGGLGNGEGSSKTLDVLLGIAFALSNTIVSVSACNLRNSAFSSAGRVATAGVAGSTCVQVVTDEPPQQRKLVMLANQWSAAKGTSQAYFERQMNLRDDPIHLSNVQVCFFRSSYPPYFCYFTVCNPCFIGSSGDIWP